MSSERKPFAERLYLVRPLRAITRASVLFPRTTLILALVSAAACVACALFCLEVRTNRLDLLNPQSQYNQRWLRFIAEFGDKDDVVVVVEGHDMAQVVRAIDAVALRLRSENRLFEKVLERVDTSRLRPKGLYFLESQVLQQIDRSLEVLVPVLAGDWSRLAVGALPALEPPSESARAASVPSLDLTALRPQIEQSLAHVLAALEGRRPMLDRSFSPSLPPATSVGGPEYLVDPGGRFAFVLLKLVGESNGGARDEESIVRLRELIGALSAAHPAVRIGLTGLPVMEYDELIASRVATNQAGVVSFLGVALLFVAGLGGVRHPLMALGALLIGIAWSVGFATVAIGHLNLLSMAFGAILVGLGIDFSIHYLASYQELREEFSDIASASLETVTRVGPGIVTGGLTTAAAFFCAGLTDFTGLAELGIIAGGGVMLCVAASLLVLPAALVMFDSSGRNASSLPPLTTDRWFLSLHRMRRTTLAATLGLTLLILCGARELRYDHNLLNLQPLGLESVDLERRLLAESNQSLWYALSVVERPEEVILSKERFLKLPSVDRVEEIVSLLPSGAERRRPQIERIRQRLSNLPEHPPQIPVIPPDRLRSSLAHWRSILSRTKAGAGTSNRPAVTETIAQIEAHLEVLSEAEYFRRVASYQAEAAHALLAELKRVQDHSDPEPPSLGDLPEPLVSRFVGRTGLHLLKVYGRGEIWDMDALERFVSDVRRVDPEATGKPLQTYEASRQMMWNYIEAAMYAVGAVLVLVWIDLRSLGWCLLAMLPVLFGIAQLCGILGWLGVPFNAANMIALPLILGIGIDDGVHIVHDFRRQSGPYRLSSSTATAVLMTSLTTMVGFGSLMGAAHRGLDSLGRVLTLGVFCCLLTSLVTLPALLGAVGRRRSPRSSIPRGRRRRGAAAVPHDTAAGPHVSARSPHPDRLSPPALKW